jgi:hypothetical protein
MDSKPESSMTGFINFSYTSSKFIILPVKSGFLPKGMITKQSGFIARRDFN